VPNLSLRLVPLINLRIEVSTYLGLFRQEAFLRQFVNRRANDPINTPYESWYGRSQLFLTRVLRTCILNIESAVCTCTYLAASFHTILDERIREAVNNPFSLQGKTTPINVYDRLPGLISEKYMLSRSDPDLWREVKVFYREIRNPLFHGKELEHDDPLPVRETLNLILRIFDWLDSWFDLNQLLKNGRQVAEIPDYGRSIGQIVVPDFVPPETPKSFGDVVELPSVEDVSGMWLAEYLQFTLRSAGKEFLNFRMSPKAAMKMLGFLALAQKHTGWPLPERL